MERERLVREMIIGIDPGKNGAIVVRHNGRITIFDIPKDKEKNIDVDKLAGIFKCIQHWSVVNKTVAVIEKVHALPREGVTSSFNFGYINGLLVMAATIYFDKVVFVTPMKWKKDLGLTESGLENGLQTIGQIMGGPSGEGGEAPEGLEGQGKVICD